MSILNTESSYGVVSRVLHWTTAVIVVGMLLFSFFLDDLPKHLKPTAYMLHKSFGLTVFALVLFRIVWHFYSSVPKPSNVLSTMEQRLAKGGHHLLYLLLLAMPMTGLAMSVASKRYPTFFELFTVTLPGIPQTKAFSKLMNQSHKLLAWFMVFMVIGHIGAALHHKFIKKNGVFERMAG